MFWTILLVTIGVTGLWLAPRHWWGWLINCVAELLWFTYAFVIGATPLACMAVIWFAVNARNAWTSRAAA